MLNDKQMEQGNVELEDTVNNMNRKMDVFLETARSMDDNDSNDESDAVTSQEINNESDDKDWGTIGHRSRSEWKMRNPNPNCRESQCTKERDEKQNSFSVEEVGICNCTEAQFVAMTMKKRMQELDTEFAFVQQHLHHKGIRMFGEKGKEVAVKEPKQQHARKCFAPIAMETLSKTERDRV